MPYGCISVQPRYSRRALPVWHRTFLAALLVRPFELKCTTVRLVSIPFDALREASLHRYIAVVVTALLQAIGFVTLGHAGQSQTWRKIWFGGTRRRCLWQFFQQPRPSSKVLWR